MANRRKTRRGHRKRRTAKRLSPHMVRAIKAISAVPQETKSYPWTSSYADALNAAGYLGSSNQASLLRNVFGLLPRLTNTITKSEQAFIGNEIMCRGVRWEFNWESINTTAIGADVQFRFTFFSEPQFYAATSGPGPTNPIFDQDYNNTATLARWNAQRTNIIFRRTWQMRQHQTTFIGHKKFYIKLRRKLESTGEESLTLNTYMGPLKKQNYYWMLETYSPGTSDLRSLVQGSFSTTVYFKDP